LRSPPAIPRCSHSLVRAEAEREQNPGHRAQTRILVDPCHPCSELWPIAASRARPHAARAPLLPPATAGVGSAGRPRCGPHQARRYRSEPSTSPCSPATAGVGSAGRPRCGPHQARRYRSEPSTSPCSPATAGVGSAPGIPESRWGQHPARARATVTRWPPPATAGVGSAPGGADVGRTRRAAIAAS
jgi:hypothetical protein